MFSMIIENKCISPVLWASINETTCNNGRNAYAFDFFLSSAPIDLTRELQLTIGCAWYFYRSVEDGKRKCELTRNEADLLHVINSRECYGTFAANFISRKRISYIAYACVCVPTRSVYYAYVYPLNSYVCHLNPSREKAVFPYLTPLVIPTPRISCVTYFSLTYAHTPWDKRAIQRGTNP